jgi:hypothetical protein
MKFKTVFVSVLSINLLTASTSAQTASGDQIGTATAVTRAKFDASRLAPVRVVSSFDASGKPILVISGESLALMKAKAARAVATTATMVTADARTVVLRAPTTPIETTGATSTVSRTDTLVVSAPTRAGGAAVLSANPLAASIERQVFVGDLPRDTSTASRGLTLGTSAGAGAAAETAIGPNGFPIFIGTTGPQSGTLPIGPNGFPQLTTSGPQSGIQLIGPNGFPATDVAPVAQTGLTREGASRDTTVPATAAPAAGGPARASTIVAPNQATAVMSTPATAVGTTAPASPR